MTKSKIINFTNYLSLSRVPENHMEEISAKRIQNKIYIPIQEKRTSKEAETH